MRGMALMLWATLVSACSGSTVASITAGGAGGGGGTDASDASSLPDASDASNASDASDANSSTDAAPDVVQDAAPDVVEDAGCELAVGCKCVQGKCGSGLGCSDTLCVPMPDPIAHWSFNGDARDVTGHGYDGLAQNGVVFTTETAQFDGIDDFIDISAFAGKFKQIWTQFTLYVRFKVSDYTDNPLLFSLGEIGESSATNGWWFETSGNQMSIITETGNLGQNNTLLLGSTLPIDQWLDVAFVISDDQVRYYLNGTAVSTNTFVRAETSATRMQIGGWLEVENTMLGEIDDVRVFDVTLDQTQVKALPTVQ